MLKSVVSPQKETKLGHFTGNQFREIYNWFPNKLIRTSGSSPLVEWLDSSEQETSGFNFIFIWISPHKHSPDVLIPDDEILRLEEAAQAEDEMKFIEASRLVDWNRCTADEYIRAIRLALKAGAHFQARKLAQEGGVRFTDHAEMQKYANGLAPAKIVSPGLPPDTNAAADMQWLKTNGENYRCQWIALQAGVLLATAPTGKQLLEQLENPKDKSILITPVY